MSLSVIPLTILGQITGVSGSGDTVLYQVSFKSIDGTPLYGVTAVWTDEQAEIEALAAQKPYGVWINPISGTFTVKFAGYTYVGSADLTDPDVLAGITPIEFTTTEFGDKLLPDVSAADDNKGMFVENGEWTLKNVPYTETPLYAEIEGGKTGYTCSKTATEILSALNNNIPVIVKTPTGNLTSIVTIAAEGNIAVKIIDFAVSGTKDSVTNIYLDVYCIDTSNAVTRPSVALSFT